MRQRAKSWIVIEISTIILFGAALVSSFSEPKEVSEDKKTNPVIDGIEHAKPITGSAKFYDKDKLLAISKEILETSKKRRSFSVREAELKSVIQAAEKKIKISGISKDLRQVSLVKNILATLLNEAFDQGFQEFEERFNKTAVLLDLVNDISYIEVNEKRAVVLYINSGSERNPLRGLYESGAANYVLVYNPAVQAEAKIVYRGIQNGSYELFNTDLLKEMESANTIFVSKMEGTRFLERIEVIAASGLSKDVESNVSEDKIFDLLRKDIARHESRHLADEVMKLSSPSDSYGNILGLEAYAYLYQMAIGELPHWALVATFQHFLSEKIFKNDPLKERRASFTLNALAKAENLSMNFDTDDLSQLEDGFAALMNLSKRELQDAALAVFNDLRGNINPKDRRVFDEIKIE